MNKIIYLIFLSLISILLVSWSLKEEFAGSKKCEGTVKYFAFQLEKKHQMKLINTGTLFFSNPYEKLWGFAFQDSRKFTIEQARPIIVDMAQSFLLLVNQKDCFKIYLRNGTPKRLHSDKDPLYPFIAIKVAFWDQDVNRPEQPYVADMRYEDGKITYYVADPKDQSLHTQLVESLDEAIKKL